MLLKKNLDGRRFYEDRIKNWSQAILDEMMTYLLEKYPKYGFGILIFIAEEHDFFTAGQAIFNRELDSKIIEKYQSSNMSAILVIFCIKKRKRNVDILYIDPEHFFNINRLLGVSLEKRDWSEKYEKYEQNALMGVVGQVIECPNCHELNSFEPGTINYQIKDDQGHLLSKEACEEYANHRCRCIRCNENFCIKCKTIPYHIGKTCDEYKHFKKAEKCRFDQTEINDDNRGPNNDVCNNPECIERYEQSCKKKLKCGHKCFGVNGEKVCPPCLNNQCKNYKNLFDQDMDAFCNICYTEGLGSAPVVLLSCNHYVHYHCIKKRLEGKWVGPKITFNHCLCPACNKWYSCPQVPEIQKLIDENKKLYDEICQMALKRLEYEGLDKDPQLKDRNSKWYNQKLEYALKRLSYYLCYVCKKPYFAGRRECGDGPDVNNDNPNKVYDPKDLVCGKDANLKNVAGKTSCDKHGKEFIEYKCRFCCKIASWFCWGTTHFCEDCHARQCAGDYVSKYPKEKLPKCDKNTLILCHHTEYINYLTDIIEEKMK